MRNCGRRRRSAASATSSSGTTWRRTSRSPRPRVPPSRTHRARTGRSTARPYRARSRAGRTDPQTVQAQADDRKRDSRVPGRGQAAEAGPGTYMPPARDRARPSGRTDGDPARLRGHAAAAQPHEVTAPGPARAREAAAPRSRAGAATPADRNASAAAEQRRGGPADQCGLLAAAERTGRRPVIPPGTEQLSGPVRQPSSPYPYSAPSYGDSSSVTQAMATPPYGQDYGYGRGIRQPRRRTAAAQRRPEPRPAGGTGEGTRTARQAYPRHSYRPPEATQRQARDPGNSSGRGPTGGYPGTGMPDGPSARHSGYQGNGYRGNGHRAPYDPRDDYRRLTATSIDLAHTEVMPEGDVVLVHRPPPARGAGGQGADPQRLPRPPAGHR